MPEFGGLWYAVVLYLAIFFLVIHLIDRLAHRMPAAGSSPTDSSAENDEFGGGETGEVGE